MEITTDVFKQQMLMKNPKIEVLGEYQGGRIKIAVKCKICGCEWIDTPHELKQGRECPECKKRLKLIDRGIEFILKAKLIHNNKYDYSKVVYKDSKTKVIIICPIHGEFLQTPNDHLKGKGCRMCSNNNYLKTTELFIKEAKLIHGNKYDYSKVEYINSKTPVLIKCNTCNQEFLQTPEKHLIKHGCPNCKLKSQTLLFLKLKESFPDLDILFEVNKTVVPWLESQRFDIYIPNLNIAIEYNGEQHYIAKDYFGGELGLLDTQERDRLKREKCINNKCTLFEIPFNYSDIEYYKLVSDILKIQFDRK